MVRAVNSEVEHAPWLGLTPVVPAVGISGSLVELSILVIPVIMFLRNTKHNINGTYYVLFCFVKCLGDA